jgi:hypothetical protein
MRVMSSDSFLLSLFIRHGDRLSVPIRGWVSSRSDHLDWSGVLGSGSGSTWVKVLAVRCQGTKVGM